jgi:hypothetical protein
MKMRTMKNRPPLTPKMVLLKRMIQAVKKTEKFQEEDFSKVMKYLQKRLICQKMS